MTSEVKAFSKNKNLYKNYKKTRSGIDRNIFFMYVHIVLQIFAAETIQGRKLIKGGNY